MSVRIIFSSVSEHHCSRTGCEEHWPLLQWLWAEWLQRVTLNVTKNIILTHFTALSVWCLKCVQIIFSKSVQNTNWHCPLKTGCWTHSDVLWAVISKKRLQEVGSRISFNTWKYGIQRYNISTFSSYLIENSLLLHYIDQFINAV